VTVFFWLLVLLMGYRVLQFVKHRRLLEHDYFLVAFILYLGLYFFQPATIASAGVVPERLQFIPWLFVVPLIAQLNINSAMRKSVSVTALILFIGIIIIRIPVIQKASGSMQEYVSVADYIEPYSTVLPLNHCHNGKTADGETVSDQIWLFMHAADYLGTLKPLIMLGNYEASTYYFPLCWVWEKNPFFNLQKNEGIEFQPPSADLLSYYARTGGTIDYVLLCCLDDSVEHPYTVDVLSQLKEMYQLSYITPNKLARLYKKNLPPPMVPSPEL
jgi:hypothetical protein